MKTKTNKFKLISLMIFTISFMFLFLTPTSIFAANASTLINILCEEEEQCYNVTAYFAETNAYDSTPTEYYLALVVNGVEFTNEDYEITMKLPKNGTVYNVYAKAYDANNVANFVVSAQKLTLDQGEVVAELDNEDESVAGGTQAVTIVFSTVVPILVLVTFAVLLCLRLAKKKLTTTQLVERNLMSIQDILNQARKNLMNSDILEKDRDKIYKKLNTKAKNIISKNINIIIPINIESMGMWNSMLASLIKTESYFIAEISINEATVMNERLAFVEQVQKIVLPKLFLSLKEVEKIIKKIEVNSESLYVQHEKVNRAMSKKEYKRYLENNLKLHEIINIKKAETK